MYNCCFTVYIHKHKIPNTNVGIIRKFILDKKYIIIMCIRRKRRVQRGCEIVPKSFVFAKPCLVNNVEAAKHYNPFYHHYRRIRILNGIVRLSLSLCLSLWYTYSYVYIHGILFKLKDRVLYRPRCR